MTKRYTFATTLSFGADGEADYREIDVAISYEVAWLDDERQRGEIEDIRVEAVNGESPTTADEEAVSQSLCEFGCGRHDHKLLAHAVEEAASDYWDAVEHRAELNAERLRETAA